MHTVDGFWLPLGAREQLLGSQTEFATSSFAGGQPCAPGTDGAVTVRWPVFGQEEWARLLATLQANRNRSPGGQVFWDRFQNALGRASRCLSDPADPLHAQALAALPGYTGYSAAMIRFAMSALGLWAVDQLHTALALDPTHRAASRWQAMDGLPGRIRFFPARRWPPALGRPASLERRPLFDRPSPPGLVVGYGAGNVPGTALLIAFLAQATALAGGRPPVVVIRNSRREPIFAPLLLNGLEAIDPELVATVAVLIWDYEDSEVQARLLSQADLVIAAASDETIAQIAEGLGRITPARTARFHDHGHKVSFSAIGREVLARGRLALANQLLLLDVVALLAALDSILWDQQGCLSSRVHFVERGTAGETYSAREYGERLAAHLRLLAAIVPRGAWPRRWLHDRYDQFKLLETTGLVQVFSGYDDEFVVAVDERPLDAGGFRSLVNQCAGRVVVVRPVADLMDLPDRYLRYLPATNLQSLSVAIGQEGEGLTKRFLALAEACAAHGVTAIRTVGRGAFPQLAYSWDGLIPLDLIRQRPPGRFATIEFDRPYDEMVQTYRLFRQLGAGLGLTRS